MGCRQFFTTCRHCGRQILMTQNLQNREWVPCDPQIFRYRLSTGGQLYVTPEGNTVRGLPDRDGLFGYRRHKGCMA